MNLLQNITSWLEQMKVKRGLKEEIMEKMKSSLGRDVNKKEEKEIDEWMNKYLKFACNASPELGASILQHSLQMNEDIFRLTKASYHAVPIEPSIDQRIKTLQIKQMGATIFGDIKTAKKFGDLIQQWQTLKTEFEEARYFESRTPC